MMNCTFFLDLKLIREHFGRDAQLLKCAEECSELAAATLRGNVTQMIEETADVLITSMNNREILGADDVDAEIRRKLARAKDRIIADMQKKSEDEWTAKEIARRSEKNEKRIAQCMVSHCIAWIKPSKAHCQCCGDVGCTACSGVVKFCRMCGLMVSQCEERLR